MDEAHEGLVGEGGEAGVDRGSSRGDAVGERSEGHLREDKDEEPESHA